MYNFGNNVSNFDRLRLQKKFSVAKRLLNTSRLGMYIDKKAIDKKVAEADDPRIETSGQNEYGLLTSYISNIDMRYKKYDRDSYNIFDELRKRNYLIQFAQNPEIDDIVETLAEEVVISDPSQQFSVNAIFRDMNLKADVKQETIDYINDFILRVYPRIYRMLDFKDGGILTKMKEYIIEGKKAWEIVYDNIEKPTSIIGIIPIDPLTLTPTFDENGQKWWVQEPKFGINTEKRLLHDSQVIFIEWDDEYGQMPYLERLIRPFNIFRTLERAKIFWYVTRSQQRTQFTIPGSGKSKVKAAQTLASAMERYSDDMDFVDSTGEVIQNGSPQIMANREFWLLETDSGTPKIENVDSGGIDLNETSSLSYWEKRLYRLTKIPIERFDPASSEAWNLDPTSQKRQEIKFGNFITAIRTKYGEVLLKPLKQQLCLEKPELMEDEQILDNIVLEWVKNNVFDELSQFEIMDKRIDHIEKLQEALSVEDPNGRKQYFFPREYLVKKYLKLTPEELKEIEELKKKEDELVRKQAEKDKDQFGEDKEFGDSAF